MCQQSNCTHDSASVLGTALGVVVVAFLTINALTIVLFGQFFIPFMN